MKYLSYLIYLILSVASCSSGQILHSSGGVHVNARTVCGNTPSLNERQNLMCQQNAHAVASALQGMKRAIHECQLQFKNEKWDCKVLGTRDGIIPFNSPFLNRGYKETAFSFALASAGVTHAVALACGLNMISTCECLTNQKMTAAQRKNFHKKHRGNHASEVQPLNETTNERLPNYCDHNINYGIDFAAQFLDTKHKYHHDDAIGTMRWHNNRVGRMAVADSMKSSCKCHGSSGACTAQTCWESTPDFKKVAAKLKSKYHSAVYVYKKTIEKTGRSRKKDHNQVLKDNYSDDVMIFTEKSPNFCNPDPYLGLKGTTSRNCNATAPTDRPENCDNMCCQREYETKTLTKYEDCNCKFQWCCVITCQNCTTTMEHSVCS